ncbi:serine threonine- kinase pim-2-like protein [Labeo rohita]|uniref:Serine threonine-kinase pim-2-like protein n=1 Tax=Labeo rohita TaxID=84645 RepID=A0A498N7I5_LABRO|nr:serine threonine- kinase pim-2-like protein [Labeo rohita]RXN27652.1 serine threonine- kinase pim-2-like protein [Labeo rohita]
MKEQQSGSVNGLKGSIVNGRAGYLSVEGIDQLYFRAGTVSLVSFMACIYNWHGNYLWFLVNANCYTFRHLSASSKYVKRECCDMIRCCPQIDPKQRIELEKLSLHNWIKIADKKK